MISSCFCIILQFCSYFLAFEVEGKNKSRRIVIVLNGSCIELLSVTGTLLRKVCFKQFKVSLKTLIRRFKRF